MSSSDRCGLKILSREHSLLLGCCYIRYKYQNVKNCLLLEHTMRKRMYHTELNHFPLDSSVCINRFFSDTAEFNVS